MVFNIKGDLKSQISDILSQYNMTVMEYPQRYENCLLMPLEIVYHFLQSSESWLSLDGQQNVLLMHCERGGWPVLAFMLAGLLLYRKQYTGEQKTLEMMYKQASKDHSHLLSPLNHQPSQMRYLQYISRRNIDSEWPPPSTPLILDCLILKSLPSAGKCGKPVARVYGQDPVFKSSRSTKLLFSSSKRNKHISKSHEKDPVKLNIRCRVQGDVVLECVYLSDVKEEIMFRVMFHTAFVRSNTLLLTRDQVDILWDAEFPRDFKAEVLFLDADAIYSTISSDVESEDECVVEGTEGKGDYHSPEGTQRHNGVVQINSNVVKDIAVDANQQQTSVFDSDANKDTLPDDTNKKIVESVKDTALDEENLKRTLEVESDEHTVKNTIDLHDEEKDIDSMTWIGDTRRSKINQLANAKHNVEDMAETVWQPVLKKPPTCYKKSASDSGLAKKKTKNQDPAVDAIKSVQQKLAELRWIPSNKGSFTNSMHAAYPHMKVNSAPSSLASTKNQAMESNVALMRHAESDQEISYFVTRHSVDVITSSQALQVKEEMQCCSSTLQQPTEGSHISKLLPSSPLPSSPLKPSPPLTPLHWSKITRVPQGSIWEEFQKQASEPELDVPEIETLFSAPVAKPGGLMKFAR